MAKKKVVCVCVTGGMSKQRQVGSPLGRMMCKLRLQ